MKFGAHIYIWTDRWSDDSLDLLDRARRLGLDCVEFICGDDVRFTPSLIRRRAEALGLELIMSPGGFWPAECDLSDDDPANRRRAMQWHLRHIDTCAEVGAVAYTGALYGRPGNVKRRVPPADEMARTAEGLHVLAERGHGAGVRVVLEPMSHFRTHLVTTPQQAMRLIDLADHENLYVLFDTYHAITEVRDYAAAIRSCGRRLWGLHACENDRGAPGGGLVPWAQVFDAIRSVGRELYVLLESYNSSIPGFAEGRGLFQNVCPDGDGFVREGMGFLRRGLGF